ncbi:PEP-utilizing enzyme, partial [Dolichospermum sp. ST_sed3]|nr:PEP-utilizing enzyme [Dolichospermum sp. ST_sed3]
NPVIKNNLEQLELLKNESRLKMNKIAFQPDSYRRLLVSKLIEKFNITKDEISSYTVDDIYKLFHGIRLDSKSIKEREKSYLILCKEGHVEYFFGDKAQKIIDNFLVQSKTDSTLIKGVIANKGYVKGRVTVIEFGHEMFKRLPEVINQMPEGNILLADTTGPELITACKKASAIITNQGGMMSHAAIVSRELNIPCIVGLGHATQAIKDGDMVEVDADNGVVKIIK